MGTSGWSYPSWVGPFYPPGTRAAAMLEHYGSRLATVEAHSTHRRHPTLAALRRWAAQVPPGFRFTPKAHAGITHRRELEGVGERMATFITSLSPLGERLGPVLFALPHRHPDLERLDALLSALPAAPPAVFELAPAWHVPEVVGRITAAGASLAVVERDDEPAPESGSCSWERGGGGPVAYARLRRERYGERDLARWAERLDAWRAEGRAVYAYLKHDEAGQGPLYAEALVRRLQTG